MTYIQRKQYVPMSKKEKDRIVEQGEVRIGKQHFFNPSVVEVGPTGQVFSAMLHMVSETVGLPTTPTADKMLWEAIQELKEKHQVKND